MAADDRTKTSGSPLSAPVATVVIPAWNQWALTEACLTSLREHTPGDRLEVVVVDNGSTDETVSALEPLGTTLFGGRFQRVRMEQNVHFGPGSNLGAERAQADRLLFLNNDTLLTPGWLDPLLDAMDKDDKLGGVGPLLLYPDSGRVQHAGIVFTPTLQTDHLYADFPADHPLVHAPRTLQALTAAALLVPAQVFRRIGGFHPGYVNGSEDLELCARIRQAGLRLTCVTQSRVWHRESATPGRFDADDANAALLKERCAGCFVPDLHRWAKRDGLGLAVTPWLDLYPVAVPERSAELDRLVNGLVADADVPPTPEVLWKILNREPLWEKGYACLAEQLEAAELWAEAATVRLMASRFFPSVPAYAALAQAAARAGQASLAAQAMEKVVVLRGRIADREAIAGKADALVRWALEAGEPELADLYRQGLQGPAA